MSCHKIQSELAAYLDDELTEVMAESVRQHLARCPRCQDQLDRLDRVGSALDAWKVPDLPAGFMDRLDDRLGGKRRPEGRMPVEARARFDASRDLTISQEERGGLIGLLDEASDDHETASRSIGTTLRWIWVIAATFLLLVGLRSFYHWATFPVVPGRSDTSGVLVPPGTDQIEDSRDFLIALREEELILVPAGSLEDDPDAFRVLCLAFLRRALTAPVDWEAERGDLEILEAILFDPALAGGRDGSGLGWLWSRIVPGTPAWADEGPIGSSPRDRRLAEGIALLGQGRGDEAAERFREVEQSGVDIALRATALAHQVRAFASVGRFEEGRRAWDRLHRDYPSRRDLARTLDRRLRRAEQRSADLPALWAATGEEVLSHSRWELGRAQVDAWQLGAAIETFEGMISASTSFSLDPALASRAGFVLLHLLEWVERFGPAIDLADRIAQDGVSPYREMAEVKGVLIESLLDRESASLERLDTVRESLVGDWWTRSRVLLAYMSGHLALHRGDPGDLEKARGSFRLVLDGGEPVALVKHVRESIWPRIGEFTEESEEGSQ